jgi:hypothetical protein
MRKAGFYLLSGGTICISLIFAYGSVSPLRISSQALH